MRIGHIATALTLTALLAGCAAGTDTEAPEPAPSVETSEQQEAEAGPDVETVPVTDECRNSLAEAAAAYDEMIEADDFTMDELNALELPPLTACETAAQWMSAARANPELVDAASAEEVTNLHLQARCGESGAGRDTPVCQDALAEGLIE